VRKGVRGVDNELAMAGPEFCTEASACGVQQVVYIPTRAARATTGKAREIVVDSVDDVDGEMVVQDL
jgi:hypothetical protein